MQAARYNNPMFAGGLSKMVESFIGNPAATAKNELVASEALLNNQTAQYREAIGETGMSGDLASMMVRALQAGPDYAKVAPSIGDNAIKFGAMGFGSDELTPESGIAKLVLSSMFKSGKGGGSGGSGSGGKFDLSTLTSGDRAMIDRRLRASINDVEGAPTATALWTQMMNGLRSGAFATLEDAEAYVTNPGNWAATDQEVVTNKPGTAMSRLFGLDDGVPDATEMMPTGPMTVPLPIKDSAPAVDTSSIPTAAIEMLKKNPALAADFDVKYGINASKAVLGGS